MRGWMSEEEREEAEKRDLKRMVDEGMRIPVGPETPWEWKGMGASGAGAGTGRGGSAGGRRRGGARAASASAAAERGGASAGAAGAYRERHDGWTEARRRRFVEVIAVTGNVRDACRVVGLSNTSAYRMRKRCPDFAGAWDAALARAARSLEATAYARAVEGVEEPVFQGGRAVGSRRRYSDNLLRLLLQGSNPEKFGRPPGGARGSDGRFEPRALTEKQIAEIERAAAERAVAAYIEQEREEEDEIRARLEAKFSEMNRRMGGDG